MSYMKLPVRKADWLLQCKDGSSAAGLLPCHSAILCNASPVLQGLDEGIRPDKDGKTVVPFLAVSRRPGLSSAGSTTNRGHWLLMKSPAWSTSATNGTWEVQRHLNQPATHNMIPFKLHAGPLAYRSSTGYTCCAGLASTCDTFLSLNKATILKISSQAEKGRPAQDCLDWALLADKCGLTNFWDDCKKFIVLYPEVNPHADTTIPCDTYQVDVG